MGKPTKYGIDISSWQGNMNLAPYKGQFVIIRAGFDITLDNKAYRHMAECDRLGIPYGVYWYSYALNKTQAEAEARACLNVIKGKNIKVGVWFDMEDADGWKRKHGFSFTKSNVSAICKAFCDVIAKAGYYTGIYASRSWIDSYINCPAYDKWVAQWGSNNGKVNADTSAIGTMLQYTSNPIDKDLIYRDISIYSKGNVKPEPTPEEKGLAVDGIIGYYTIEALQKWMGTYIDGEIWGQVKSQKKYYPAILEDCIVFDKKGSPVIKQLQNYLVHEKLDIGKSGEDGILGKDTVKALQELLNIKVSNAKLDTDGILGENTAKALQSHLNKVVWGK